jgi:uncharacterized cupin superfamily protein
MRRVTVSAMVQVPEAFSILDKLLPGRNYFIAVWPGNGHFYSIELAGSADLCGALRLPFQGMKPKSIRFRSGGRSNEDLPMSEKASARTPANTGKHLAPGFIDLRAFASAAVPRNADGNAYLRARDRLALPPGPISVAACFVDAAGTVEDLGADEFIVVVEGRIEVRWPNGTSTLQAGQSAVLPKGASFAWSAPRPSRLIVMSHVGRMAGHGEPILIDETAELQPSSPPSAELLVGPTPSCRNHSDYRSASGEFVCGVWDSTPYHRRPMFFRHYELMHLLEGAVTLEDAAGHTATFSKGDILLMVQGSTCSWLSECHVTKVYATFRPAS